MSELAIFLVVASGYAATHVDNLAVLVSIMIAGNVPMSDIARGHALSTIAVLVISSILGLSSHAIPIGWIGFLGLVPIGFGIYLLLDRFRNIGDGEETLPVAAGSAMALASLLTANSVDAIVVFSPLFADSQAGFDAFIAAAYIFVAVSWYWLARLASHHAAKLEKVRLAAGWIAPLIMIGVGIYIMLDTATDLI